VECPGFEGLQLQHFYRTCAFLSEVRERLETELFLKDRDLFHQELDLVFLDTTSTFVYRDGETELFRRGYSRDRRPEWPQVMLCVAVDRRGWPAAWEFFPGNTSDRESFQRVIAALRQRFHIREVTVVADRGMISAKNLDFLETGPAPFTYILGCRMRKQKEVSEDVLSRAGRYETVADNLKVKEVWVDDRRYLVCHNPAEANQDTAERAVILDALAQALHNGGSGLIANRGYRRYLIVAKGAVQIIHAR